jgi:signal transduction histidine kinase
MRLLTKLLAAGVTWLVAVAALGLYVPYKEGEAERAARDASESSAKLVQETQVLAADAADETTVVLAFLAGAADAADVGASRQAFRDQLALVTLDAEALGGGDGFVASLRTIQALENDLHRDPARNGRSLAELVNDSIEQRASVLAEGTRIRSLLDGYQAAFADGETDAAAYAAQLAVSREQLAVLDVESAFADGSSAGSIEGDAERLNEAALARLATLLASEVQRLGLAVALAEDRGELPHDDAAALQTAIAGVLAGLTSPRTADLAAAAALPAQALDAGVPVPRATVRHVQGNVTAIEIVVDAIRREIRVGDEIREHIEATILLHQSVRLAFGPRSAALREGSTKAILAAEALGEARVQEADASSERTRNVMLAVTAGVIVVGLVAAGIGLATARNRLREFATTADAVGKGEFDAPAPPARNDEFDVLGRAWEQMTGALAQRDRELNAQHEQLRHSERMATLGSLVAGVAHEVNNPLSFALLNNEMTLAEVDALAADASVPEAARKRLAETRDMLVASVDGIKRAGEVARALKTFGGSTAPEAWAPLGLNGIVDGVLIIAHNRLKGAYKIEKQYGEIPPVLGSSREIGQIALNLVMNAADASPKWGSIRIRTWADASGVHLRVTDDGPGVTPDVRARLFQAGATSKPTGSGLGLHISRRIAEAHGGTLVLDEGTSRGASFTLTIPTRTPTLTENPA